MALHLGAYNNLDGICTDGNGYLYVIDTWGRIFKVDIAEESFEVLVSSGLPDWPQDCVYDPFEDRIVVAAFQASAPVVAVDPNTGEVTTLTTNSVGRYDGITIDQYGNFYFSTFVAGGRVHKYPHDFSDYSVVASGLGEPTGLCYNQDDNILAVPSFNQHTVHFIQMSTIGLNDQQAPGNIDFIIYPNPNNGKASLKYQLTEKSMLNTALYDQNGRKLDDLLEFESAPGSHEIKLDMSPYPAGVYMLQMRTEKACTAKKLVVR
jgi:hypothetical protein